MGAFVINTNISAMNAHRYSAVNNSKLDTTLNSLSSGLSINKAADNASGLAVAHKLSVQSRGLGQAIKNSNEAIGMVQTFDSSMEEQIKIAVKLKQLSIKAANDTQDSSTRALIKKEIDGLWQESFDIHDKTKFHGIRLTDSTFSYQVGAYSNDTISVKFGNNHPNNTSGWAGAGAPPVSTQAEAEASIDYYDTMINTLNGFRADMGAVQNQLESNIRNISVTQVNVSAAQSNIRDADFALESSKFAKQNIIAQSGSYAMSQANSIQNNVMRLLN